jgi:hypothetical protein
MLENWMLASPTYVVNFGGARIARQDVRFHVTRASDSGRRWDDIICHVEADRQKPLCAAPI